MTRNARPKIRTVAAVGFAATPIAFGAIRAITTGTDLRYLVTAVASLVAAAAVFRGESSRGSSRWLRSGFALAASTLAGGATALWQGAASAPAVAVVAVSFGLCFTASGILGLFVRRAV